MHHLLEVVLLPVQTEEDLDARPQVRQDLFVFEVLHPLFYLKGVVFECKPILYWLAVEEKLCLHVLITYSALDEVVDALEAELGSGR